MAGRKKVRHRGLRSQKEEMEPTSDAVPLLSNSSSEEEVVDPGASGGSPGLTKGPEGDLAAMMRDFLRGQQQREDRFIAALQGLEASFSRAEHHSGRRRNISPKAAGPSSAAVSSPRLDLPTPAATSRRRHPVAQEDSSWSDQPQSRVSLQPPDWRPYMEPKVPPYQTGEDIENYLLRFERIARTWRWPETEWACRLVPLLSGKALEAYTAMDEQQAHIYKDLKDALLVKFDISPETYRQQFRSTVVPSGENPTETYHRLKGLYRRWIRPEQHSKEQIGEIVILEQLLRVLPADVRTWVKEHDPEDGLTAARLALQYLNARRGASARPSGGDQRLPIQTAPLRPARRDFHQATQGTNPAPNQRAAGKDLVCFYCQQIGHKASVCPIRKTKFTGACYAPRPETVTGAGPVHMDKDTFQPLKQVTVNGQQVTAMLDTGSFVSLVKQSLIPFGGLDYSRQTSVVCVHGDQHLYPKADVTVTINEQSYLLTVGVVENLPVDLILGCDLPMLGDLLNEATKTAKANDELAVTVSAPVLTRAQAKAGMQGLPRLDDDFFDGGKEMPRKSRRQRRFEKKLKLLDPEITTTAETFDIPADISALQKEDQTLKPLFAKVTTESDKCLGNVRFIVADDVLYAAEGEHLRLVLPTTCRPLVMHLAHTLPWAGHLGRHKTYLRVSSRFFWPSMYTDIQTYCATCPTCQKTAITHKSDRALLHPLPIISTPFRRIAMDIVGPLPKSSSGHEYILVVCDYATRFPEAFPLRTITAPAVMRALIQFFSRVGIPDEILTDQGTNFTSRLMKLFQQQLGITAIKATPYHPQTNGLVERFNQTLKRMLQKFVSDTGKDWDRWLPFLLFAYREVPQASTGFSPFELLYGWDVQGPLDLLKKSWEAKSTKTSERGVIQFVLEMRERLAKYREEAEVNQREAQRSRKTWYDQQARHRELLPGQKVLLLLPSCTSKLLAKWQGPYTILRRMGPVTYEVHHPDKKKEKQTYHVNLLKEWKEGANHPTEKSLLVRAVKTEEDLDSDLGALTHSTPPSLSHLPPEQTTQIMDLFRETPSLFSAQPGRTILISHSIRLKDGRPIRQRPYRVPQKLVGRLNDEVRKMLELGVIEPSNSEWSSPVVIVPKKDDSLRICIDFRKLNAVSEFDAYPMPRIDDLLEKIGAANFITTLDLCKGYWQVPLSNTCRPYTAFKTPAGLFQFTVMPFGLHGAPATFQRLMDRVLQGCNHCSAAYLDDVVIYSHTWEQHLDHLRLVLRKLQNAGLTLNVSKCEWARKETRYLGYLLGGGEVRPQVDKVEVIRNCPRPRTKKEVRSFLGLAGWYRRFVHQFATIAAPLTALTEKRQKNPVTWTDECEQAFQALKNKLCSCPVLKSPNFDQRFLVQVDASAVGLGAVLAQGDPGEERPVLYLSQKLQPRETRYSTVEKEGLAIKWALDSLRYYLLGREFDLETDHRALTWINTMKDHHNRLTRWYLALQPYKFNVRHRPGKQNIVADFLSRLPHIANLPEEGDDVTV
uniref:Gypsy retrotransposon integrase-like protein 1 n=1 Tax=Oryzias latipes TaxID=8090 RepID=A0A3P9KG95_ORYLA